MIFNPTCIKGAMVVEIEPRADERGLFARGFCRREFEAHGLNPTIAQANIGVSLRRGTLRGLHYQTPPHAETKLVRCTAGAVFDVIVDLRPESPSYKQWMGVELSAANRRMLYAPEGCAHGYLALADATEVFYLVSEFYFPGAERGVRWDDPAFAIEWPLGKDLVISDKDRSWPDWTEPKLTHAG